MRTCRGTITVFLLAAIIMVIMLIGNTGRAYAISHLTDFDHGSAGETIAGGGDIVREIGDMAGIEGGDDKGGKGNYTEYGEEGRYDAVPVGGKTPEKPGEAGKGGTVDKGGKPAGGNKSAEEDDAIPLSVKGRIEHTPDWDRNRGKYNSYAAERGLDFRGDEVFWPGEVLVLTAETEGPDGAVVIAEFAGTGYRKTLSGSGSVKKAEVAMRDIPGAMDADSITVIFKAEAAGETSEYEETIAVDDSVDYWMLHRKEAP